MFLLFVFSALTLTVCIAGVYFYNSSDADWYNASKETCIESVTDNLTQSYASDIMFKEFMYHDLADDFEYWVTDEFGKVIAETPGFRSVTEKKYKADLLLLNLLCQYIFLNLLQQ